MTTGYSVQLNKAVVGGSAFAHESGIHQHGVLSNRATYEIMDPVAIGLEGNRLVLGKHSGRHAFVDALDKMGYHLTDEQVKSAFARFKELADRKIQLTDADIEAIVAEEAGLQDVTDEVWLLEALEVSGGTDVTPKAKITVRRGDEEVTESAKGNGPIDAACTAVQRATGVDCTLVSFNVAAITGGTDALGDVVVQVDIAGRRFTGRGVSVDTIEASARAYLAAINRSLQTVAHSEESASRKTP
jgi:2-isopropylmalate synthase